MGSGLAQASLSGGATSWQVPSDAHVGLPAPPIPAGFSGRPSGLSFGPGRGQISQVRRCKDRPGGPASVWDKPLLDAGSLQFCHSGAARQPGAGNLGPGRAVTCPVSHREGVAGSWRRQTLCLGAWSREGVPAAEPAPLTGWVRSRVANNTPCLDPPSPISYWSARWSPAPPAPPIGPPTRPSAQGVSGVLLGDWFWPCVLTGPSRPRSGPQFLTLGWDCDKGSWGGDWAGRPPAVCPPHSSMPGGSTRKPQ